MLGFVPHPNLCATRFATPFSHNRRQRTNIMATQLAERIRHSFKVEGRNHPTLADILLIIEVADSSFGLPNHYLRV